MSREHELKTASEYYQAILSGEKQFEVRHNDRNFMAGDVLILKEGDLGGNGYTDHDLTFVFTGRELRCNVTYVLHGGKYGIQKGFCVMSITPIYPHVPELNPK